jgi:ABC-type Na+ efflux pump permease subunit
MRRSLFIATTEFLAFVRSKTFLFGLILPPAIGAFAIYASMATAPAHPPPREYPLAILDPVGSFAKAIEQAAAKQNTETRLQGQRGWILLARRSEPDEESLDELRHELIEQVKRGEIWAFVEVPGDLPESPEPQVRITIHAAEPPGDRFEGWLAKVIEDEARALALHNAELPRVLRTRLERQIVVHPVLHKPASPESTEPKEVESRAETIRSLAKLATGGALAVLAFLLISICSAPLMQGVLEEKANRVSETLLSSVSAFELMLGKLLGGIAGSGFGAILYLGVLVPALIAYQIEIPTSSIGWFAVFLVLGALLWGSVFLAIGSACADIKDTQNLVMVALLFQMLPLFFMSSIMMSPASPIAVTLSLFPPTTPLVMLLRLSLEPTPSLWQPVLAAILLGASALFAVWIAGRIFRVGLLIHARSATLRELWRWGWAG